MGTGSSQDAAREDLHFKAVLDITHLNQSAGRTATDTQLELIHLLMQTDRLRTGMLEHKHADAHTHSHTHSHTHTRMLWQIQTKAWEMLSLPCRVIICHSQPFSHSGDRSETDKLTDNEENKTTRPQTSPRPFLFIPLRFNPGRTWFRSETSRRTRSEPNSGPLRAEAAWTVLVWGGVCSWWGTLPELTSRPLGVYQPRKKTDVHCRGWCVQTLQ